MNRISCVQIRRRLLLKVTEISCWKSYFYPPKMIFHLLFLHSYLSYVTSFFIIKLFRLDLRNFIQVWWATLITFWRVLNVALGSAWQNSRQLEKCRYCSEWIAGRVFNQILLRLNFRFGKDHHLLISKLIYFSADRLFTHLYLDRQGPVTIWLTACIRVFCHLVNKKNMVNNKNSNSINSIIYKYCIAVKSLQ